MIADNLKRELDDHAPINFLLPFPVSAYGDQLRSMAVLSFPLSLRMVEETPAARSIDVTYETVR